MRACREISAQLTQLNDQFLSTAGRCRGGATRSVAEPHDYASAPIRFVA